MKCWKLTSNLIVDLYTNHPIISAGFKFAFTPLFLTKFQLSERHYVRCYVIQQCHLRHNKKPLNRRYHTITGVYTATLLLTKPLSDDDSGCRHGFGTEASLPLAQSTPAIFHNTTRLCQIVVAKWDCQIHTDAIRALSWIFSMYFLLSNGGSPRLVKKMK